MARKPNLAYRHVWRDPQNMKKGVQMCCQHLELDFSETFCISDFSWKFWQSSNTGTRMVMEAPTRFRGASPLQLTRVLT